MPSPYMLGGGGGAGGPPSGVPGLMAAREHAGGGANLLNIASFMDTISEREKKKKSLGKAADYFKDAMGGDEWLLSQGIHPDQWDNLGAQAKGDAMKAMMEAGAQKRADQLAKAKMDEIMGRTDEQEALMRAGKAGLEILQQRNAAPNYMTQEPGAAGADTGNPMTPAGMIQDEAPAGPVDAQGQRVQTSGMMTGNPWEQGGQRQAGLSQEDMLQIMADMGKTSPKLQSALMRTLMPKLLSGAMDNPKAIVDSFDLGGGMKGANLRGSKDLKVLPSFGQGEVPTQTLDDGTQVYWNGRAWQATPVRKETPAPKFQPKTEETLATAAATINSAQAKLAASDDELKNDIGKDETVAQFRARQQRVLNTAQKTAKAVIDSHAALGTFNEATRDKLYQTYGLKAQGPVKDQAPRTGMPAVGEVRQGYRFKGGDPKEKSNWQKVQ